jgi:hypothetical protein
MIDRDLTNSQIICLSTNSDGSFNLELILFLFHNLLCSVRVEPLDGAHTLVVELTHSCRLIEVLAGFGNPFNPDQSLELLIETFFFQINFEELLTRPILEILQVNLPDCTLINSLD